MEEQKALRNNITEEIEEKEEYRRSFIRFAVVFLLIFAFIASLRTFVYQSVEVDGSSMENTLYGGDLLVVDKTIPLSRGEVVVFRVYGVVAGVTDKDRMYIKRIIGMPGDTVWTENGVVHRSYEKNGEIIEEVLNEPYVKGKTWRTSSARGIDMPKTVVQENCYLMMGDNRENSYDCRAFGAVDKSYIVGVVPPFVVANKDNALVKFFIKLV